MVLGVSQPVYLLLEGSRCKQHFLVGLAYLGQTSLHQVVSLSFLGDAASRGMGVFGTGPPPWLQMPFPPYTLGGLQGRRASLQVALVPQEETLEVYAVINPKYSSSRSSLDVSGPTS